MLVETRKQVKEATRDWEVNIVLISILTAPLGGSDILSQCTVNSIEDNGLAIKDLKRLDQNSGAENSCLPSDLLKHTKQPTTVELLAPSFQRGREKDTLLHHPFPVKPFTLMLMYQQSFTVSEALCAEGAILLDQWFVGCNATYVVCEGPSVQKIYATFDQCCNTAMGSKSAKEKCLHRLVHLSADLARYTGARVDNPGMVFPHEGASMVTCSADKISYEERRMKVNLAKWLVRRKRRNNQMQPPQLLPLIRKSSNVENGVEDQPPVFFDAKKERKKSEASFVNLSRPLTEKARDTRPGSGPSTRARKTAKRGYVEFRRIDFLGSRRSFEMLKRVKGDNNSNLYELLIPSMRLRVLGIRLLMS
ncbi:hypothetical protein SASPL_156186 [Salvia splendens]|uniref:Uncharacterized protein n=1 Tax=Salvia splendens TaxID=180675 RepID=A0A8X8VX72_SALSN|nr:hypothetical protein SASPL_156186 [Salvia splendens]